MKKTFPVSWDRLHNDTRVLAQRLNFNKWNGIIAITRGGLIPAAIIATELNIRVIDTLCISSYIPAKYEFQEKGDLTVLKGGEEVSKIIEHGKDWLLIDDLVDSGQTARVARELLPWAYFATLYAKPDGKETVDTFITEIPQDTWVVFPWEAEPPKGPWG